MYRFLLRPLWLLSHVLIGALLIGTVLAGFWQLSRLDERRALNDLVAQQAEAPPVPIGEALSVADPVDAGADLEWRTLTARGVFDADTTIRVANRSNEGQPGEWWISPLDQPDGTVVFVNRGFVPIGVPAAEVASPAAGEVVITGLARPSEERVGFGAEIREGTELDEVPRVDLVRIGEALAADRGVALEWYPVWLQLDTSNTGTATSNTELPRLLGPPDLGEGPHQSYAVQWFIFFTIGVIGYPLVLRRLAQTRSGKGNAKQRRSQVPIDEPPPVPSR